MHKIDRMAFDNWEEHEALYADAPIVEMDYPLFLSHRQVPMEIRARLLDRAATWLALKRAVAAAKRRSCQPRRGGSGRF